MATRRRTLLTDPTITVVTPLAGGKTFLVTEDRDIYMQAVERKGIAFTWREMNRLLDAEPTRTELFWTLKIKEEHPGVRIDDIKLKMVTYPQTIE